MLIDLDEFKIVNDTLGHSAGDELLTALGRRLRGALPATDTVARLGGDEFAVLVPRIPSTAAAVRIADRLIAALGQDFALTAGSAAISGSVGLATGRAPCPAEMLTRHADAAMYRAKTTGERIVVFDPVLDAERPDRLALFGDLRALVEAGDPDGQLMLYHQPQVRIRDAAVVSVEALARWRHPVRGLLLPDAFLPVAQIGGLEIPLTFHLLRLAVRGAVACRDAGRPVTVAVNVSPRCLLDDGFLDRLRSTLADSGLPPSLLRLEVTEDSMATDPDRATAVLRGVRQEGVQVSIDDFGTGFSSLIQLKRLPADELKIDRTLVRDVATEPVDAVLVGAAIGVAHDLGLTATAEGVETPQALLKLREMGCDNVQGHGIAAPVPVGRLPVACAEAEQLVRGWTHGRFGAG